MTPAQAHDTALYTLCLLGAGVAGVEISGFFPVRARPDALRYPGGRVTIAVLGIGAVGSALTAVGFGLRALPWPAAVIAGGIAALAAPMVFECAPRRFWDSPSGVAATAIVNFGLLGLVLNHRF